MTSNWLIVMPEAGTNLVLNPSAEDTGNFAAHNSATVTRDTTYARFGDYCYKIVPGGTNRGVNLTLLALGNAVHYVTFYAQGNAGATLQVSLDSGSNYNAAAVVGGATGGWVRYGVSILAAQANGSTALIIRNTANETYYIDAVQVEQKSYFTTYIDGDRPGGLYSWTGHRHASTSTRDAQARNGGRERDLLDDYGMKVMQWPGAGMPQVTNNLQPLAIQPGATFQSTKTEPRQMVLTSVLTSSTLAGLHSRRKALIDLIKPDGVRGAQPFIIGYKGANSGKYVYGAFRYADGLGIGLIEGGANWAESDIPISLLATQPYWYEDNRETASLNFVQTLTSVNRVIARVGGLWQKLGSGFNNTCYASAYDPNTGRIYFAGDFTTANGVTVNRICYWNPYTATFTAMDSGTNGSVRAIAIAPNGDVWIGGLFTTVGTAATACKGLAKWSRSGASWSVPTNSATLTGVYALCVDINGILYGGGDFLNFGGVAACDYIFKYDGATFTGLGGGMDSAVFALAVWIDGTTIYVGGNFTTGNSVTLNKIGYWNGTTFVALTSGGTAGLSGAVYSLAVTRAGNVYAGGVFATNMATTITLNLIGMWNGQTWSSLGGGATGTGPIYALTFAADGLLYVAGGYTAIGPFTTGAPAIWDGTNWRLLDLQDVASTSTPNTFTALPNGDLYVGDDTANTRIAGTSLTAVTSTNSVACFPTFTIFGPTSTQMVLKAIRNISSDQAMLFNLTINPVETYVINLTPGDKYVASIWRGQYLSGQPLPTSDFANWCLLPTRADGAASNQIVTFVTGTTTGAVFLMHWVPLHWSLDGVAA